MAAARPPAQRYTLGPLPLALRAAVAVLVVSILASAPVSAASRHAAMVIDMNTGQTLLSEQADEPRFPASLTKMMTIYMTFEQIEAGRLMPWTKLKVSPEAVSAQPTKLDLAPGEQIAVMDAVKALITKSANDMAIVLAEAIGGTEQKFAELMTQKARALGMSRTTFRNASGLPDGAQVTTARDMLTLAMRLQDDFPKHFPLFATKSFTYNGATHRNHNTLLGTFEGIDGIKTGYTRLSGFNLVTSIHRGDKHLVAAVFGGATAGTRNVTMRTILTRSLLKASTKKTRKQAPVVVARAKPAAAPVVVAAAAQPVVKPAAVSRPRPAAVAPVEVVEQATPPEPVEAVPAVAYELAKVRPVMVMVATRVRTFAPPVTIAEPAADTATPPPPVAVAAAPAIEPTPAPHTTQLSRAVVPVRGTAPSTLQAQAETLAAAPPPAQPQAKPQLFAQASLGAPSRLRGPEPANQAAPAVAEGGVHIQIGAFGSRAEAERALNNARDKSQGLLNAATPVTAPVQKENRQLFRARFAGFDAKTAANTCMELRRLAIDCFVMKAD